MVHPSHVLDPRPGGPADHIAERAGGRPAIAAGAALVGGYVTVTAGMLVLGLIMVKALMDHGVGTFDSAITDWLVARRSDGWNDVTRYATYLANTEPVVAIAAVVTAVLLILRRWREAIFLVSALVIEITAFLSVNYLVDRPRPDVERLNATPSTGSFPSGHAAASLVLWVAIALIVAVLTTSVVARIVAWLPVATLVWIVPLARVYRGMHHSTDVLVGLLLGVAALVVGILVARTWAAAVARRHGGAPPDGEPSRPQALAEAGR